MKRFPFLGMALAMAAIFAASVRADEIRFTTLPAPVQTTIIRETHIQGSDSVTRVVETTNGVYAVTVHGRTGDQVVYVNPAGELVQAPAPETTITTVQQPARTTVTQPGTVVTENRTVFNDEPTVDSIVRSLDSSRYQLIEKRKNQEIYLDKQTGAKWMLRVQRVD